MNRYCFIIPAGLGIANKRWEKGAYTNFYEPLLPAFKIPDLWHYHEALLFHPKDSYLGGFGLDLNFINFGSNELTDEVGKYIGTARSYEWVFTAGWGFDFKEIGLENHYFGLSAKLAWSQLAPGMGIGDEGVGRTIAFDAGYIWEFSPGFRLAFNLANMGPPVYYITPNQSDPIPFTVNTAIAYKNDFYDKKLHVASISTELRLSREAVKNHTNGRQPDPFWQAFFTSWETDSGETFRGKVNETNINTGVEVTFLNTFSLRQGFLLDCIGRRYETHIGLGFQCFNHFQFDWYYTISPEGYMRGVFDSDGANGSRNTQWGISVTFFRLGTWLPNDNVWWMK